MLIIDDLLFWLPLKGIVGIAGQIQKLTDEEVSQEYYQPKIDNTIVNNNHMKALYLYAITKQAAQITLPSQGIEFGNVPEKIAFQDLIAIVSAIDITKMNKKEIEERLKTDLAWTKKNVYLHHQVIQEIGENHPVIPMKFATILKEKDLHRILEDNYGKFKNLLQKLADKEEWGLKVYLDYEKTKDKFLTKDLADDKVPSGHDWYWEKKKEESASRRVEERLEKTLEKTINETVFDLENMAVKVSYSDPLPQALTGREEIMVLNGSFLLDKQKVPKFQKLAKKIDSKIKKNGFIVEISGPWPPYNFVEQS